MNRPIESDSTTLAIPPLAFEAWMQAIVLRTEDALAARLPAAHAHPVPLHDAMRYATLGGGKRIRALLCHAAGALTGAEPVALDAVASSVEMIHAYSLVHDDLPAMDDDVLRRGRPTVHVKYGEALAVLVGDALQSCAFESLAAAPLSAELRIRLVSELATASGSLGMVGGQAVDLASTGTTLLQAALERMHRMKTGSLLRAAVLMGAQCGAAWHKTRIREALENYQHAIGLAFQVVDDVLDATVDTATLGKTAGKDAEASKPTYVSTLGLDASRALALQLVHRAQVAVASLGGHTGYLDALAARVVHRFR